MTCHFQVVSPALSWPGPATGAEQLASALPGNSTLSCTGPHVACALAWASESCCPCSEAGVCPGTSGLPAGLLAAPVIGATSSEGRHDRGVISVP